LAHRLAPPFARAAPPTPAELDAATGLADSTNVSPEQKAHFEARVRSRLANQETVLPTPHVLIPAWMAETYFKVSTVLDKMRRLWLPHSTLEHKLPYHQCALLLT
jgi:hypothetical protein